MKFIGTYSLLLLLIVNPLSTVIAANTQLRGSSDKRKKNVSRNKTLPGPGQSTKRRLKKNKCKTPTCGTGNYQDCPDDQGALAYIGVCSCAELDASGAAIACANLGPDGVDNDGEPTTGLGYIGDNSCFGDCDGNGDTRKY